MKKVWIVIAVVVISAALTAFNGRLRTADCIKTGGKSN